MKINKKVYNAEWAKRKRESLKWAKERKEKEFSGGSTYIQILAKSLPRSIRSSYNSKYAQIKCLTEKYPHHTYKSAITDIEKGIKNELRLQELIK